MRTSSCCWSPRRVRDPEGSRIFDRHSSTHVHLETRSSWHKLDLLDCGEGDAEIKERNHSRPRIGARERNDKKASLTRISGDVSSDETVCCDGEVVDATVWRISPI